MVKRPKDLNSCLLLSNHLHTLGYAMPAEVRRDAKTAEKRPDLAADARDRIATAVTVAEFAQQVTVRETRHGDNAGDHTGNEVKPHWRRGHWRMQHHGAGNALLKRVLIKPVLVRADRFVGDVADTEACYR